MKNLKNLSITLSYFLFLIVLVVYDVIMSVGVSSKVTGVGEVLNFLIVFFSNLALSADALF